MTPRPSQLDADSILFGPTQARPVVFGEVLFDHFPDGKRVLGGAPFNVAWHLEAFGLDPLFLSSVGSDGEGREALDRMETWGLDTAGIQISDDDPTGRVEVRLLDDEPHFEIPPDQAWDRLRAPAMAEAIGSENVAVLYHGTLALRNDESFRALREVVEETGAHTFVDLNLRAPWWTEERVEWCLSRATWLKLNGDELQSLTELPAGTLEDTQAAAAGLQREHAIPHLIVTLGDQGAVVLSEAHPPLAMEAVTVSDFVDSVGAGDAFSSVWCLGVIQGWSAETTLSRALAFAAEICRHRGATVGDLTVYERHVREWAHGAIASTGNGRRRSSGLHIMSLSVHGLVRGSDIELGHDPDTGGQVSYVIDQARSLAAHPDIASVDVVTRLVEDRKVESDYADSEEQLCEGARLIRIPFGPRRYLRKESLWPHLDSLLDQLTRYIRGRGRVPDVIHGHYADAGYVGAQLAKLMGVPFVFTGHSLGRVKRARLLAEGTDEETIEDRYRINRRIEAEEWALETAALIIASTTQEVHEQYELYDHYDPGRMEVIPPGVDVSRFSPPPLGWRRPPIAATVNRFLRNPSKPMILALARADERKNFPGLIRAYAETPELRSAANLVLIAGNREDIREMPAGPRRVLTSILLLVDYYDLHGSVAYPKQHGPQDTPDLFRMAARSRGVFVNPALTEPFGLTLLEAAATGLPVVATNDGGPRDILAACQNGVLVDPLDSSSMGLVIREVLSSGPQWGRWSKKGVAGVHERFSWTSHARRYVEGVERVLEGGRPSRFTIRKNRILGIDRLLVTDVDETLTGDDEALRTLLERLRVAGSHVGFGIATGRPMDRALEVFQELEVRTPDVLITSSGAQLHYGKHLIQDRSWEHQIRYRWNPEGLSQLLSIIPGFTRVDAGGGAEGAEGDYRLRYRVDSAKAPTLQEIRRALRKLGFHATLILDHGTFLDVLPVRASPGLAIRFFCFKWNLPPERLLVAGDSGNDLDMLSGDTLGVVVGNHSPELEPLRGRARVHFAEGDHAWGILEGIDRYDFLGSVQIPEELEDTKPAEETESA